MVLMGWVRPQWGIKFTKECIDNIFNIFSLRGGKSKTCFNYINEVAKIITCGHTTYLK